MEVLDVDGLCKHYDHFELQNVSFNVHKGEIMGFIGRNGAGKTTTLKSILNYVHPSAGKVTFFGLPFPEKELEIKRRIGFVTGGVDYYVRSKLRDITSITRSFYPDWDRTAYQKLMRSFDLDENKTPAKLSAGMKVKYSLTLALSHHAELLVLDEPTSGLDPISRDDLLNTFLSLQNEGISILFSTHITSDLDQCADRITYIRNGSIFTSEDLETFRSRYRLVELASQQAAEPLSGKLIGLKPAKHGFTALLTAQDAASCGMQTSPADLDDIMVHLEKEAEA